ncbi:MAG: cytochrome c maturation protein CcmE [Pseudomonadota bacterium]|nr:cytochrome c maturation protein CcmE [Pseudomonadota bacterium]
MTRRQQRMVWIAALVAGVAIAATLAFSAFRANMMYFYTPSDLADGSVPEGATIRLGGLVETGSVKRGDEGLQVLFTLADCSHQIPVSYEGILPDLFREGQGVVTTGKLGADGRFVAAQVLAKHDENYMPPDLAESLKTETGHSCAPFKPVTAAAGRVMGGRS